MYRPLDPSCFQNTCKTCCSLDYDITENNSCNQKFKMKVKKPFKMSRVPSHLLNSILTKMYYKAFMKFRQTKKEYEEYVATNRDMLRIAWYHDKEIEFSLMVGQGEPTLPFIWLGNGPFRTLCRHDSKELKMRYGDKIPVKRSILDRLRGISYFHITRGQCIYLHDLEENQELRRELTGCYIPVSLSVDETQYAVLPDAEWASFCTRFENFLHWSGIKHRKVTFENISLGSHRVFEVCSMIQAQTLFFRHFHIGDNQILSFKDAERVCLGRSPIPDNVLAVFPKIESLRTYLEVPVKIRDLEAIVKTWIYGNGTLKELDLEMDVSNIGEVLTLFEELMKDGDVEVLTSDEALDISKNGFPYYDLLCRNKHDTSAFLLKRKSDGAKAIWTMAPCQDFWMTFVRMIR